MSSTFEQDLHHLFNDAYLPLMSSALILTHLPEVAAATVSGILARAAKQSAEEQTPIRLFHALMQQAPLWVTQEGFNPVGFMTLSATNNIGELPPGRRPPLILPQILPNPKPALVPGARLAGIDTSERWVLHPLLLPDKDLAKTETKANLLWWMARLVNSAKITAILAAWFGYDPESSASAEVLEEIASCIGSNSQRIAQLWQTQDALWQEVFFATSATLWDALELFCSCQPLDREDIFARCLQ